jgi:sugar phosphate permease
LKGNDTREMEMEKKQILYYGWVIVAVSFVAQIVSYAMRYNFSLFYVAILHDFGWTREATALAFSINLIAYALSAPLAGTLVARFGIRRLVSTGAVMLGLTLFVCSRIHAIWELYIVLAFAAIGVATAGFVPHLTVVTHWFSRKRGLAIGIVNAGVLCNMLLAPVVQYLISSLGWRGATGVLAAWAIFILAPLAAIFHRDRPEDKGLHVDGDAGESSSGKKGKSNSLLNQKGPTLSELSLWEALGTYRFWSLSLMFFFLGFYLYLFLVHQVAYLADAGYSKAFAAQVVSIFGILAVTGSLCTFISDRLGREITFTCSSALVAFGLVALTLARDPAFAWAVFLYAITFGFAYGMSTSLLGSVAGDLFQGKSFGAISGTAISCFVVGGAVGPWLGGRIFDTVGSYNPVFPLAYMAIGTALIFIWLAAPRKGPVRIKSRLTS